MITEISKEKKCEHIYGFNYGRPDEREYLGTVPNCEYDTMFAFCPLCGAVLCDKDDL